MANELNSLMTDWDNQTIAVITGTGLSAQITTTTTPDVTTNGTWRDSDFKYGINPGGRVTAQPTEKVKKPGKVKVKDIEIGEAVKELGREAEEVLGYARLSSQIKKAKGRKPLLDVLRKLDIELLDHVAVDKYKASKMQLGRWLSHEISDVELPVPEHVLSKAVQIKKEMPAVKFYVESLQLDPDPFLYAEYNGERYYIEVWDEPEFEHPGLK